MKFYKFALWKAYFDKGYGTTTYPKWILATIGLGSVMRGKNILWIVLGGTLYGLFCFFLGWLWYKYRLTDAEIEVTNRFNPFVNEVRKDLLHNPTNRKT